MARKTSKLATERQIVATAKSSVKSAGSKLAAKQRQAIGAMYRPVCKILVLIGVATLLLATVVIWQYRSSTKRLSTATGIITEVNRVSGVGKDENGDDVQKCKISYSVTIDGRTYTDALGYRGDPTTDKCALTIGEQIPVKYDSSHPANNAYQVDDQLSNHGTKSDAISSATSITIVGIIPLLIGLLGLRIASSRRDDQLEVIVTPEQANKTSTTKTKNRRSSASRSKDHK